MNKRRALICKCEGILIALFLLMITSSCYSTALSVSDTRPIPRISSVSFDKDTVVPGELVTVAINVTNEGSSPAPYQTIHIGLPFNPDPRDIQIVYSDLDMGVAVYPAGSDLGGPYGPVKSAYTIVEGVEKDMKPGEVKTLVVKIRMPDVDTLWFDVKTVACDSNWKILGTYPTGGLVDQQGEFVEPYALLKYYPVRIESGKWNITRVALSNPNRYSPIPQPEMIVSSFEIVETRGFNGSVKPLNIPLKLRPGMTDYIELNVTAPIGVAGYYTLKFKVGLNIDAFSFRANGVIGAAVLKSMAVFIGRVETIETNSFIVDVVNMFESIRDIPKSVRVIYDPDLDSIILGKVIKGDEVFVYGYPDEDEIRVDTKGYGLVNLAYGGRESKQFTLISELDFNVPFEQSVDTPLGTLYMNALFAITMRDRMGLQLERYGLARANGPGVLVLTPKEGDGLYDIRFMTSFRIMDQQITYEKSYSATYTITIGRNTYFTMPRIGISIIDVGAMKLEVGISLSMSYTPTNLFCLIGTNENNVAFDTNLLNYTYGFASWTSHTRETIPFRFLSSQRVDMNMNCSLLVANVMGNLAFDLKITTPLGEKTLSLIQVPLPGLEEGSIDFKSIQYNINPEYLLTVESNENTPTLTIKVNNAYYQVNSTRPLRLALMPGTYEVVTPEFINESNLMRFRFSRWSTGDKAYSIALSLQNDIVIYPIYLKEYKLTVLSEGCGTVSQAGESWVQDGYNVTITAQPYRGCSVKEWLINSEPQGITYTQLSITMNEPKTIKVVFMDIEPPTVKIRVSKDKASPGEEITFDASDSQDNVGIAGVYWDFGDGSYAEGTRATHKYSGPGTYVVRLIVKDQAGNIAQETVTIIVEAPFPWIYVIPAAVAISVGVMAVVYYFVKHKSKK